MTPRLNKPPPRLSRRVAWGAGWGLYIGLFLSIFSLFDDSSVGFARAAASLGAGGIATGALYASLMPRVTNKVRAGIVMSGAAIAGSILTFYGWRFPDFVGMGLVVGVSAGLTHAVLFWKPSAQAPD